MRLMMKGIFFIYQRVAFRFLRDDSNDICQITNKR